MAVQFEIHQVSFNQDGMNFLKIGKSPNSVNLNSHEFSRAKHKKIDDICGTLGWANDAPLDATGKIEFSKHGNKSHKVVTKEITELLNVQNPEIDGTKDITERFIDLSKVKFNNIPKEISSESELHLRFDLFLEKDEGALVYMQDNPIGTMHSKQAVVNLITPERTDSKNSQDRYALSYIFPYNFGKKINLSQ